MKLIKTTFTGLLASLSSLLPFLGTCPGAACAGCGGACYTSALSCLGLGTSGMIAGNIWTKLHPLFAALATILLSIAWYSIYRKKGASLPKGLEMPKRIKQKQTVVKIIYWFFVVVCSVLIIYPLIRKEKTEPVCDHGLEKIEQTSSEVAFFNVDCLEFDEESQTLSKYRPRLKEMEPQLDSAKSFARENKIPMLITTCCSGRMPVPGELSPDDAIYVALSRTNDSWKQEFRPDANYYIAKQAYHDPKMSYDKNCVDMFLHNKNLDPLLDSLNINNWVVFGNGFQLCVVSAVKGLRAKGYDITIVEDLLHNTHAETDESRREILDYYKNEGIKVITLHDLLNQTYNQ